MLFQSIAFIPFLLGLVLALALSPGHRVRILLFISASWFFYGWWDMRFLPLLWAYTLGGWGVGLALGAPRLQRHRRAVMWLGVGACLGALAFFKYTNFLADLLYGLLGAPPPRFSIVLPIGISFMTFEVISYLVDVYKRKIEPCRNLTDYALFTAFFPRVISGPIIRAADFFPQVTSAPVFRRADVALGLQLFLIGIFQKTVLADNMSLFVDRVYLDPLLYSAATLWLVVMAYSAQIFCDFAGYSLMAIGLARLFGFSLPPNFDFPYLARSLGAFWRRWHISLSLWLRDYLYIPLGGSRLGRLFTWRNLLITMVLAGLWHGAGWNFVLWGGLHGLALVVENMAGRRSFFADEAGGAAFVPGFLSWAATFLFVSLTWVVFRSPDMATLSAFGAGLAGGGSVDWFPPQVVAALTVLIIWHLMQFGPFGRLRLVPSPTPFALAPAFALALLVGAVVVLSSANTSPFIYFRF